jgi:hypothetical protein
MHFFEAVISTVATSVLGAIMVFLGADAFVNSGLSAVLVDVGMSLDFSGLRTGGTVYYMFAGMVCLAVTGFVVQMLTTLPKRKN